MRVSKAIKLLQELPADEEIVIAWWARDLFGDGCLTDADGDELAECPRDVWDAVASEYALQEWEVSAIHDDITYAIQGQIRTNRAAEGEGRYCPACGDKMTVRHSNYAPTWSDSHDDIVCWTCSLTKAGE
jgi:hypothetical protein